MATALVVLIVAGCASGDTATAPPGSTQRPLVNDAGETAAAASQKVEAATEPEVDVVARQRAIRREHRATATLGEHGNPCSLVTVARAQAILGGRLLAPFLAPQGPTCVYRSRSGASFATIAVETLDVATVRRGLRRAERVTVGGRAAYCGVRGRPMLYVPMARGRLLTVSAPCQTALRLARVAVSQPAS